MQKRCHHFLATLLAAALIWASLPTRPAYASMTYTVNSLNDIVGLDGSCTLREAIEAANNSAWSECGPASAGVDTIIFSVSGTITLSSALPNIAAGAGALTIDGTGQNITISGNNAFRVFVVNTNANLTLQNLTVADGKLNFGGGIYNNGTLTLTNVTFRGNSAAVEGGGIYNNSGTLTLTNVTFSGNSAAMNGGGIYHFFNGTATLTNVIFSGNTSNNIGGGMSNYYATATLTNVTFSGNSAVSVGGGMYNYSNSSPKLTNVTFSDNSGGRGGGMFNYNSSNPALTNVTFGEKQQEGALLTSLASPPSPTATLRAAAVRAADGLSLAVRMAAAILT